MTKRALVVGEHGCRRGSSSACRSAPPSTKWRSTPPKASFEIGLGEDLRGRAIGQNGALDQHGAVAEFGHAAEIVGGDQHHPPLVAQIAKQSDDRLLGLDVDAGERLVEQDHLAVLGQRAGEEDALSLAAGQLADLALAEVAHADAGERLRDRFTGRAAAARRSKSMWP